MRAREHGALGSQDFHDGGHGYDAFGLSLRWLAAVERLAKPLYEGYFRVDSRGIEQVPREGPVILASNHGGMLPVDGLMLAMDVLRGTGRRRVPRVVMDHFVTELPWIATAFARIGAVRGHRSDLDALLHRGAALVVFPEGVPGIGKDRARRYQLQPWRVGHAELALVHRVPVVPVAIAGAEDQWLQLARIPVHPWGIPYLPIPANVLPLPARYHIRYGAPLALHERLSPSDPRDPEVVALAAQTVKESVSALLVQALAARRGVFR
jgi:1-acyl-sn-glycerol-3-phosphate acyltransferase